MALGRSPESLSRGRMLSQNINPIVPTRESILGITQAITKAYQVTDFNKKKLICTISMSYLFTQPKWSESEMCIRSIILIA